MAEAPPNRSRVRVDGKFFRVGEHKFYAKGVCYGPLASHETQGGFASPEQTARDFVQIRGLGANVVRLYDVPPRWFLDLAEEHELKLLIDLPWHQRRCILDSARLRAETRTAIRNGVRACAAHPAVFAFSMANEIPPEIVRWSGAAAVSEFLEELVDEAKALDPDCLCTFGNFPSTEFLRPRNLDFHCFNVYLHQRRAFENYLARLQTQADAKPLVLGEFGIDSIREGEVAKCEILGWQIEAAFRHGLAGAFVYSFTDDWFKDGRSVEDWALGLTTREREPKAAFFTVQEAFQTVPYFPLPRYPKVSVVLASYNGGGTLKACLDSLLWLNYPDYEIILVDDGSTDATPDLALNYKTVRFLRQNHQGLSVARNTGIAAAEGEIVAFTDCDCRPDEDWLYYLVGDLLSSGFVGVGGHNLLPQEDSGVAAAVMASPGGPAPVLLSDREAEHLPGCNLAVWKWALQEIDGFDPVFHQAGDDVDVCWRLQQRGYRLGFSSAGFVWHHRRAAVGAYLRQQEGYGEAEAMLVRKHPEYFNVFGGSLWRGRIYTGARAGFVMKRPLVYHGTFATAPFQTLYTPEPASALMLCTSLEYHVLISLPLLVLSAPFPFLFPIALASLALSLGVCIASAVQADLPHHRRHWWSRPLVALLFLLQPMVRGWARYQGRLALQPMPEAALLRAQALEVQAASDPPRELYYWANQRSDRVEFLNGILRRLDLEGWPNRGDSGWSDYDLEIYGHRWSRLQLTLVSEDYADGKRLFRCRLRSAWSLPALVAFWAAFAVQLFALGVLARGRPWLWTVLLSMPLLGWYLRSQKRALQRVFAVFLDEMARHWKMTKLRFDADKETFLPAEEPPRVLEPSSIAPSEGTPPASARRVAS